MRPEAAAPALVLARSVGAVPAAPREPTTPLAPERVAQTDSWAARSMREVVSRDVADATSPEEDASQASAPGSAAVGSPAAPAQGGLGGSATQTTGAPGAIPERDLDEMVRRLYPRLRRSLSSELLVARERAGTLADLR
jgi:hypothetical protein